jgi:hypothetical protein
MTTMKAKRGEHQKGAADLFAAAHMENCVTYSSSSMPPFPTSSMSRSFQYPGWDFDTTNDALT